MTLDAHPYQTRYHAENNPDGLAYKMCATGEMVTFRTLEDNANQGAHLLRSIGIKPSDHIAILMENRCDFLEICFAADRAGIFYTTISTHLTKDEIAHIVNDCGARILITSSLFRDTLEELTASKAISCPIYMVGDNTVGYHSWCHCVGTMPTKPIDDEVQGLDMLYSSGTTGKPKGVKWALSGEPPGTKTMLIELLTSLFGYDDQTRYLSPAPLYHAAPLRHSMVTIKMGGAAFIMNRFDPMAALNIVENERITHSQWVPTMFVRLLKLPKEERDKIDMSSMKMAVHAAAPCPIHIKQQMIDWWGDIIHEYYSGTENNGFTAITTREWLDHQGSVGQSKLGTIHICDDAGNELPIGEVGEVYFENGHQFTYHNAPDKTAKTRNEQGWTTLGDIGRVDADGYLYLTDRKSFMIISGGVNIYPQEAEDILISHPAIMDAAVIGVPHEELGEEVKAVVQLVPNQAETPDLQAEIITFCRERLSSIKCPKSIDFNSNLPRSATGKLYKRKLRDEYWAQT